MELIIFLIIIVFVIIKNSAKQSGQSSKNSNPQQNQPVASPRTTSAREAVPNQARREAVPNQAKRETVPNQPPREKTAAQLKDEIWARLSEESKAKMLNRSDDQQMSEARVEQTSSNEDMSAAQQIHKRRMEERNTSIFDRAKGNNADNAKDVTLATMEEEHNHSERVAPAVHNHPEDNLQESMLGSIEDLMVKGYDGNLCFERDFLGEAIDMIGRFTGGI